MKRYEALAVMAKEMKDELVVLAIGGMIDEWYALRPDANTFYNKAMGYVVPCALGLAVALPHRQVVAIDGDASFLLGVGVAATLGNERPRNLVVVVLDNECHEIVGGPPSHTAGYTDLAALAKGAGVEYTATVRDEAGLRAEFRAALAAKRNSFIVAKVEKGTKTFPEDERKRTDGKEDKYRFVRHIEDLENITIIPRELPNVRPIAGDLTWEEVELFPGGEERGGQPWSI